jgi:hypothetical protein
LLVAGGILWQFNFFLRTDIYYILTTALGCRNLAADARASMIAGIRRALKIGPRHAEVREVPRQAWLLHLYTAVSLLGVGVLMLGGALYLVAVLRFVVAGTYSMVLATAIPDRGIDGRMMASVSLLVTGALLTVSLLRQRRQLHVTYRLRSPAGL